MGTDLNLDLWGNRLAIRAESSEAASLLRSELRDHLIPEKAPTGFVVKTPDTRNGLFSLLDRSGLVLARGRVWEECVPVLAEHLATFAPPPPDTVRTLMRAIVRDSPKRTVALAAFPLLSLPPMVERQLERRGQQIVDRLATDLTPTGELSLSPLPWPTLREREPNGHCGALASGLSVSTVLLPTPPGVQLGHCQSIAHVARSFVDLPPDRSLDLAEQLIERVRAVPIDDASARRHALEVDE